MRGTDDDGGDVGENELLNARVYSLPLICVVGWWVGSVYFLQQTPCLLFKHFTMRAPMT